MYRIFLTLLRKLELKIALNLEISSRLIFMEIFYCYLSNKSISELLNISITQVSKLINSLKNKNYISIELIYKENSKQIEIRKL